MRFHHAPSVSDAFPSREKMLQAVCARYGRFWRIRYVKRPLAFWAGLTPLALSLPLSAQTIPPPPPAAPEDLPPEEALSQPEAIAPLDSVPPPPPPGDGPLDDTPPAEDSFQSAAGGQAEAAEAASGAVAVNSVEAAMAMQAERDAEYARRVESRKFQPTPSGATGLLRTPYAGSGDVGTFRFGLYSGLFSGSSFLCPSCVAPDGQDASVDDDASRVTAHLAVSATLWPFLEAYLGVHSYASSNSQGQPKVLQVLADTDWGLKFFMPQVDGQLLTFGGAAELQLLNGAGTTFVDNASFALRALSTLDLTQARSEADRIPLRVNASLSYLFDNSSALVTDSETERGRPLDRIERYGLAISRVDAFTPAVGVEGVFQYVHPFVEWSVDVPVNRQGYQCRPRSLNAGDVCLNNAGFFSRTPSRLTLGARGYAFLDGLAFLAALDIATGGSTTPFWDEATPETPWLLQLAASYAADSRPQIQTEVVQVGTPSTPTAPAPAPRQYIEGIVIEEGTESTPVPGALIYYEGRALTGMIADDAGRFRSAPLEPGDYAFALKAEHFEDGVCQATVPPSAPPAGDGAAGTLAGEPQDVVTALRCELKALPRVGTIEGYLLVGLSRDPVSGATVKLTNESGQELTMAADDEGAFVVTNVPAGRIRVVAEAEGYLQATTTVSVVAFKEAPAQLPMFKRPKVSNIGQAGERLTLQKKIEFVPGSAEFAPAAFALLDELADYLRSHATRIEVRAYASGGGAPELSMGLSSERAGAIAAALVANGVPPEQVIPKGMGEAGPQGDRIEWAVVTE